MSSKIIKYFKQITLLSLALGLLNTGCKETTTPPDDNNNNGVSPVITSLSKTLTFPNYELIITGSKFGVTRDSSYVEINGLKVEDYISWSDISITIKIPANATSGKVVVTVGIKKSNGVDITIEQPSGDPPEITDFDVNKPFPRQQIGIIGKFFGDEQGNNIVTFNGIQADNYISWKDKKIVVFVPTGATTGNVIVYVNGVASNPKNLEIQNDNILLEQILIPAGIFNMGAPDEPDAWNTPVHSVRITKSFYISKYEISQKIWETCISNLDHNSYHKGVDYPVERVSWINACQFCNQLSKRERFTSVYTINGEEVSADWNADGYRLPTEAEWEYAARAGSDYKYGKGADGNNAKVNLVAWHNENADNATHAIGTKEPNAWGLYDMLGNVMEWCWDWHDPDYYSVSGNNIDPKGPDSGFGERILRGGSYTHDQSKTTCSYRWGNQYLSESEFYIGFRVVRNGK